MKRLAEQGSRNDKRAAAIEAAIIALDNDDLLDLADIFEAKAENPIKEIARFEMAKRGISL
ncbi:hypothetical protein [Sphingomonas sp. SAFR-052]|uniref:hypothetical protein n=1 Tax=Sphingomonas sp. SAFR-052 TaxID=3436867 RepID=UPI003F7FB05F